ncbi:MAG: AIPR family protein [Bacilli bacterium]|jgi:hypothetical protein|nr:AIPR family protein [Bacilli bacterium]
MEVEEFYKNVMEETKATAAIEGEGSTAAFLKIITDYLQDADVLSGYISTYFVGVGRKQRGLRVDGYYYDELDNTMNLITCHYTENEIPEVLTKTLAITLFDKTRNFVEDCLDRVIKVEESTPVSDLADYLSRPKTREHIRKIRMFLLTNSPMSGRIKELPPKEISGIPVEFQIWDLDRVHKVCFSSSGKEDIEIDFEEITGGLPCIEASCVNNADYKSYLCIIPGVVLANIYDKYGSRLLEENVRMFLSTASDVNKKIKRTIQDEPDRFFAYNNGISVTSRDLVIKSGDNGKYIAYTRDFQIINGGQTTASLSNTRHVDKSSADKLNQIYVPMKLTVLNDPDPDRANDLIRNISHSANSQNKVSDADFFSTHPFHIAMEKISRKIYAPAASGTQYETHWYYERVRGQYLQNQARMKKSDREKFKIVNPKHQVINKTDIAKIRNTWAKHPDTVSKGAQTNFKDFAKIITDTWATSPEVYDDKYFKESVALKILFRYTEDMVTHQSWYERGYRANIVTYTLALFHVLIEDQFRGYDLNLMWIWSKQEVPIEIKIILINLSKVVYDVITSPDRPVDNVTQWCKRSRCWNEVQDSYMDLGDELKKLLVVATA